MSEKYDFFLCGPLSNVLNALQAAELNLLKTEGQSLLGYTAM
jgi:hypothetical protein